MAKSWWDVAWPIPSAQDMCALKLLQHMEDHGVCPDRALHDLVLAIFGRSSSVMRKCNALTYWFWRFGMVNDAPHARQRMLPASRCARAAMALQRIALVHVRTRRRREAEGQLFIHLYRADGQTVPLRVPLRVPSSLPAPLPAPLPAQQRDEPRQLPVATSSELPEGGAFSLAAHTEAQLRLLSDCVGARLLVRGPFLYYFERELMPYFTLTDEPGRVLSICVLDGADGDRTAAQRDLIERWLAGLRRAVPALHQAVLLVSVDRDPPWARGLHRPAAQRGVA